MRQDKIKDRTGRETGPGTEHARGRGKAQGKERKGEKTDKGERLEDKRQSDREGSTMKDYIEQLKKNSE